MLVVAEAVSLVIRTQLWSGTITVRVTTPASI